VISAGRGDIVDGVIQGDLAGSRQFSHPTPASFEGPRCGPVGGSMETGRRRYNPMGKADRCPPRSQTARSSAKGGVMPADPPRLWAGGPGTETQPNPAKGPTETKLRSEHHGCGEQRDQRSGAGGPPVATGRGEQLRDKEVLAIGQYLEQIADPANLARAWASVRANA